VKIFYKQYRGKPLRFIGPDGKSVFYGPDGQQAAYPRAFYGAIAVVHFLVQNITGTSLPGDLRMEEHVSTLKADPLYTPKPDMTKSISVGKDGWVTDLQVHGFNQDTMARSEWRKLRNALKNASVVYRQELCLVTHQTRHRFAVIVWRHSLDKISIEDIYGLPE
jgi:hypothetical protein